MNKNESKCAWVTAITAGVVVAGSMLLSAIFPGLTGLLLLVSVFVVSGIVVFAFASGEYD